MFAYHAAWSQLASAGLLPRRRASSPPAQASWMGDRKRQTPTATPAVRGDAPARGRPEAPLAANPFKRTRKGVPLSGSCRRTHERERSINVQRRNSLLSATLLAAAATPPWDKWRRPRLGQIAVRNALYPCRISPVYGDTHIGRVSSRPPRDWSDHQQVART
jgi:hypothetical protein